MQIRKKTDWTIRNATPADHDRLATFIGRNAWANAPQGRELYRWKYERDACGTVGIIATNTDQELVASSMFMPWTLSLNGKDVPACQWGDLFLAPEYRGQAIADLTLQGGLEQTRHAGRHVCFAFPNASSVAIHKKNKALHLGLIVRYAKPLSSEYLLRRRIPSAFIVRTLSAVIDAGLTLVSRDTYMATRGVERVDGCGAEFDTLWQRFSDVTPDVMMTRKDAAYLTWKYLQSPSRARRLYALRRDSTLEGWIVIEADAESETGFIIDLLATSDAGVRELIAFAVKTLRREGCRSAAFLALEHNRYFPAFGHFGFVPRPDVKRFYVYLGDALREVAQLAQPHHWFITIADCDVDHL